MKTNVGPNAGISANDIWLWALLSDRALSRSDTSSADPTEFAAVQLQVETGESRNAYVRSIRVVPSAASEFYLAWGNTFGASGAQQGFSRSQNVQSSTAKTVMRSDVALPSTPFSKRHAPASVETEILSGFPLRIKPASQIEIVMAVASGSFRCELEWVEL